MLVHAVFLIVVDVGALRLGRQKDVVSSKRADERNVIVIDLAIAVHIAGKDLPRRQNGLARSQMLKQDLELAGVEFPVAVCVAVEVFKVVKMFGLVI